MKKSPTSTKKKAKSSAANGLRHVDKVIALLQDNRENIGALVISVAPRAGKSMTAEGETSDAGFTAAVDVNSARGCENDELGLCITTTTLGLREQINHRVKYRSVPFG